MEFVKKNPKIFVLSGKAESGKSVVASMIGDYYSLSGKRSVIVAYASYLKEFAKEITDWDGSEDTKPREFLQQVGVELIKNQINPSMLIDRVIDDIRVYSYFFDVIVVSDARFVDEINVVKNNFSNVTVIHIDGKVNSLTFEQRNHSTETGLDDYNDYDYVIENTGNLSDLKSSVESILEVL